MNTKQLIIAIAVGSMIATPTLAAAADLPASPSSASIAATMPSSASSADLQLVFQTESTAPIQVAAMSQEEMKETEGALAPAIIYGLYWGAANAATLARFGISGYGAWRYFCQSGYRIGPMC